MPDVSRIEKGTPGDADYLDSARHQACGATMRVAVWGDVTGNGGRSLRWA
jgi:hypothetical protein